MDKWSKRIGKTLTVLGVIIIILLLIYITYDVNNLYVTKFLITIVTGILVAILSFMTGITFWIAGIEGRKRGKK